MIRAVPVLAAIAAAAAARADDRLPADDVEPDLLRVPAGRFVLGRPHADHLDEMPPHRVLVSAFLFEATLVTVDDYAKFVGATGYRTSAEQRGSGKSAVVGMKDWEWREVRGASWRAPWGEANAA